MKRNEIIEEHYKLNYNSLVKKIVRRVPDRSQALAEEVVQEAYARALKYFKAYKQAESFDKWFGSILRNATNDCRSAEGGGNREFDDDEVIVPFMSYYEANEFLRNASKYSERDRNILHLFYLHGFTSKDIAIYSGLSHTNIRQIIYKFKSRYETLNGGS